MAGDDGFGFKLSQLIQGGLQAMGRVQQSWGNTAATLRSRADDTTSNVEAMNKATWVRIRAFRDAADPYKLLGGVFGATALVSGRAGVFVAMRNSFLVTAAISSALYPYKTYQTARSAKKVLRDMLGDD